MWLCLAGGRQGERATKDTHGPRRTATPGPTVCVVGSAHVRLACCQAAQHIPKSVVPKLGKGSPGQPGVPRRRAQAPSSDLDLASRMELPMQDDKMAPQVHSEPGNINRLTTATGAELVGSGPTLP